MKGLLDTGSGLQKKVVTVNPSWIKTNIGLQKVLKEKYVFNRLVKVFVARWWPQKKNNTKNKKQTNKLLTTLIFSGTAEALLKLYPQIEYTNYQFQRSDTYHG